MTSASLPQQIYNDAQRLGGDDQRKVLEFIRSLPQVQQPKAAVGLAELVGSISKEDLRIMELAIEEGCEQIDANGW